MQKVLTWEKSIKDYPSNFSDIQVVPPSRCDKCGCTKLYRWGRYKRYVLDGDHEYHISIRRFRCVKCLKTYSYLPSFCFRKIIHSADIVMELIRVLLFNIQSVLKSKYHCGQRYLERFVSLESLWLVYLRTKGFEDILENKMERSIKIFTALQKQYASKNFLANFLLETGRHFMSKK